MLTINSMTLLPAYGRDYKSKKEVQEAWDADVDFLIAGPLHISGKYINKSDRQRFMPSDATIYVRYWKKTKIMEV